MNRSYVGSELDLFSGARNWKSYFAHVLAPFIGERVLEVGAGIGSNIPYLYTPRVQEWTSLEPDAALARRIADRAAAGELPRQCRVVAGTIENLDVDHQFDTILYIDTLEHIADDDTELSRAASLLSPGGNLVVLAPAHQFLFSPFDRAIGHWRRYSLGELARKTPCGFHLRARLALDSVGFLASLANRLLLRSAMPSRAQIAFWDRILVPLSRFVDAATGRLFGKTVVVVWSRAP